jgi:acetate kinase
MDAILVVNAGSSSLKFQIFSIAGAKLERRVRGQIDGIGARPRMRAATDEETLVDRTFEPAVVADLPAAIAQTRNWLRTLRGFELCAIGHRVVHGGPEYAGPVLIDEAVLDRLAAYQELAPLHQPNNLAPISLMMEVNPAIPQIACFDTAFHRGHAAHSDCYALPRGLYDEGVRRYGFHGLSYEYIAERLHEVAPEAAQGRTIVAHLGSGASMCALIGGRSVESTMGFTALDGLPMGTRPGQLDPGVVLYLISQKGMRYSPSPISSTANPASRDSPGFRTTYATCWRATTRVRPLPSTTSSIGAGSTPASSQPRSVASMPSSSPLASAKTPPRSAPVLPNGSLGSAPSSTPAPTKPAQR